MAKRERPLWCPFCDNRPKVKKWKWRGASYGYSVVCEHKDCSVHPRANGETRAGAIRLWNIRGGVE